MPPSGEAESIGPSTLAITNLVVERPGRRILDGTSFTIAAGAAVAVTGPSGAGKTTLLHAVAGLVVPEAGTVSWGDLDITSLPEAGRDRWRRDNVGLVFQDFQLLAELTVLENVLLPIRFDHWRTPRSSVERAERLAARVGLDPRGPRAGKLSRGEQQRLAIARALMRTPRFILADEPTASLDAENSARIADLLFEASRETQASLLLISHDAGLLARASRVHRLDAGVLT